jgi:hypothetical protein
MMPSARILRCLSPASDGRRSGGMRRSNAFATAASQEIGRMSGNSIAGSVLVQIGSLLKLSTSGRDTAGGNGVTRSSQ